MQFDWSINLGDILTAASFAVAVLFAFASNYYKLEAMDLNMKAMGTRLDGVDEELKKQTEILINQAAQRERMVALERRVDELYKIIHKVTIND